MNTKMTHAARAELADAVRRRYRSATGKQKRRILDEFVATTGYHVKSAMRVLNGERAAAASVQTRNSALAQRNQAAVRALPLAKAHPDFSAYSLGGI
jgi:hypothetical protein